MESKLDHNIQLQVHHLWVVALETNKVVVAVRDPLALLFLYPFSIIAPNFMSAKGKCLEVYTFVGYRITLLIRKQILTSS